MRRKSSPATSPKRSASRSGASPIGNSMGRGWDVGEWDFSWLRGLSKIALYVSLIAAIGYALNWFDPRARIDQFMNRPIAGVSVESEFKFISQQDTQTVVAAHLSKTFLELDMLALKQALEANPWTDKVMISRSWPDKLVVHIQEQKPIARWENTGFINMRGEIIKVDNVAPLVHLPVFKADQHYAKDVMQQYLLVKNITSPNGLLPIRIEMDATLAWTIHFTPAITIKLGREKSLEKLQNIAKILRTDLAREVVHIETIDMRYDNGFAVSWRDGVGAEPVAQKLPASKLIAVNQPYTTTPTTSSPAAE